MKGRNNEQKEINSGLRLLAKSSMVVFIGLFLSKILSYAYRVTIARQLGPEVYGLFSLAIMIVGWFVAFFSLGLQQGVLRYFSFYRGKKDFSKIRYLFKKSIITLLVSGFFAGGLLFLFSGIISSKIFHNQDLFHFLKLFSILIPISILGYFFLYIIKAFEEIGWYSFIDNVLQNLVKIVLLVLLLLLGAKSNSIIFSEILGMTSLLIVSFLFCKYKLPTIFKKYYLKERKRIKLKKEFVYYSLPIMFFAIVSSFFYWIDSFSIGFFKGVTEVGIYNAAAPIAALLLFVPNLFIQLFFPLVTREYAKKNIGVIENLSKQVTKWICILNLPLLIIMIFFPGALLNILFGPQYLIAENALRFLAIGAFFSSLFLISHNLVSMVGKSKIIFYNILALSMLNIFLNALLIPRFGINGAAFSTMVCSVILGLILLIQTKYYISISPLRRKLLRVLLVSIIPTILLFYVKQFIPINLLSLLLLGSLFVLVYLLIIFLTGCLDKNDLMILRVIKGRLTT